MILPIKLINIYVQYIIGLLIGFILNIPVMQTFSGLIIVSVLCHLNDGNLVILYTIDEFLCPIIDMYRDCDTVIISNSCLII